MKTVYEILRELIENQNWESVDDIANNHLPSGSGIDCGCQIDHEESTPDELVIHVPYHHMSGCGYYVGWSHSTIHVKRIPGQPYVDMETHTTWGSVPEECRWNHKDYLEETIYCALEETIPSPVIS